MTKRYLTLFLFISIVPTLQAQSVNYNAKISLVENGLRPVSISVDTVKVTYNILDRMKFHKVPSVSLALIENGKIEWAKAYGYADVKEKKLADTSTVFQVASLTKTVNAVCVMKLAQQGKLDLNKDIRTYLTSWKIPENEFSKGKKITLKNLLSHTGGFGTSGFMGYEHSQPLPTINQMLNGEKPANHEAVKTIIPANTQFSYSGGGTLISRKILEDNIASNYDSLVQAIVLKPLGMKNSTFEQNMLTSGKSFATAYNNEEKEFKDKYYIYPELAPDGLWSTATDMAKMVVAIQQSLKNTPGSFLNQATAREMVSPVLNTTDIALGTFIIEQGGEKYFCHLGGNLGFKSAYYGSFTTGKGVVILANSDNGFALINEIVNSIVANYDWKQFNFPIK